MMNGFYFICILLFVFFFISLGKIVKLEKDVRKLNKIIDDLLKKIEK
mgnify:CR=1 FL=1